MSAMRAKSIKMSRADKFSTFFANIFSSLRFVIIFFALDIGWVILNKIMDHPFDAPPFEMKNSIVSDMTLFIDLIIIMVQRRITALEVKKTDQILHIEKDTHADMDRVMKILQDIENKYLNENISTAKSELKKLDK